MAQRPLSPRNGQDWDFAVYVFVEVGQGDKQEEPLEALNLEMESCKDIALPICGLVPQRVSSDAVGPIAMNRDTVATEGR